MSRYGWQTVLKERGHLFHLNADHGGLSVCGRSRRITASHLEEDGKRVEKCGHCMKAARKLPSAWVGELEKVLGR